MKKTVILMLMDYLLICIAGLFCNSSLEFVRYAAIGMVPAAAFLYLVMGCFAGFASMVLMLQRHYFPYGFGAAGRDYSVKTYSIGLV